MGQKKGKKRGGKKNKKDSEEPEWLGTINPEPDHNLQHSQPLEEQYLEKQPLEKQPLEEQPVEARHPLEDQSVEAQHPLEEQHVVNGGTDEHDHVAKPTRKRKRGPTRLRDIAKNPNSRLQVNFTFMGEHYGPGSVKLSTYLGIIVREHVPVDIESWPKVPRDIKTILWTSVKSRFALEEDYQKKALLAQMGRLWRSHKSRVVREINEAASFKERMDLRPKNIVCEAAWRKFVKIKTSPEFKVVSDSYKKRKKLQIPHTSSRKGIARLTEEMKQEKQEKSDLSDVTRTDVWVRSRTRKDGTPVNTDAAEKIKKAAELVNSGETKERQDTLVELLGPDNPGRMRAMGSNMTKTKLACFQVNHKYMVEMEKDQIHLKGRVNELENQLVKLQHLQGQETEIGENSRSAARSVNKKSQPKCILIDWAGDDANVAEGRIISTDPEDVVNEIHLGPLDYKVLVETATVPEAFLWRNTMGMSTIEDSVGQMIAWPATKCVSLEQGVQEEDMAALGTRANSVNKCKLLDLSKDDVVVAEGRWTTQDQNALVNGLKLGPKAVKVFVDVVHEPNTFIWRPTMDVTYIEDCEMSFVAWPFNKVVFENNPDGTGSKSQPAHGRSASASKKSTATGSKSQPAHGRSASASKKSAATGSKSHMQPILESCEKSPTIVPRSNAMETQTTAQSPLRRSPRKKGAIKENQKCMLLDIKDRKQVVADGKVNSIDPEQSVHFVRLGPNTARVWIDTVSVDDAAVWRTSDGIEYMKDALGSFIAWPIDHLVMC